MGHSTTHLQKTIFETLNEDTDLLALIGEDKVLSHVRLKTEFPYIVICNWQTEDWSTSTEKGELHRFDIDVWDDNPSTLSHQNIGSKIIDLLHDQPLSLDVGNLVNLRFENSVHNTIGSTKLQPLSLKLRATIEF